MAYFLVSVSNRTNLDLCLKYALAGFTNSENGFWTFVEIAEGDYISFLYGARVFNLYRVVKKVAFRDAGSLPPWPSVTFRESGKTYYFPFRLYLRQERSLNEPMVRPEFAYVAENLLLRGGYRKTHFQADSLTFYGVSSMGEVFDGQHEALHLEAETYTPKIVFRKGNANPPVTFRFRELFLQSLVRKVLSRPDVLRSILGRFGIEAEPEGFEVLGEKALPEGHVDLLIKSRHPAAVAEKIVVEVKTGWLAARDQDQLLGYMAELGPECKGGVLVGKGFPARMRAAKPPNVMLLQYRFEDINEAGAYAYEQLLQRLRLDLVA